MNNCLNCNSEFKPHSDSFGYYCSNTCQREFEYRKWILDWKNGIKKGWTGRTRQIASPLRKYILEKYNSTCIRCGWNKLHPVDNKPLVEINHIDGDAENCIEENLEVLCPNCHSETHNFRSRNKKSKRDRRPVGSVGTAADL